MAYVLASGLPPRTLLYTVVPDPAFSSEEQNSGPSGPLPCLLWGKPDGDKLAENLVLDMLARAFRRFAAWAFHGERGAGPG